MVALEHPIDLPAVDRHLLLQWIIRHTREQYRGPHLQRDVAERARLAQSTISNIESLSSRPHSVRREHLLQLAVWGLDVPVLAADAWSVLFSETGEPLSDEEVRRYYRYRRRRPTPSPSQCRAGVLTLLDSLLEDQQEAQQASLGRPPLGAHLPATTPLPHLSATNVLAIDGSERGQVSAAHLMYQIEGLTGQRMEVGRLPKVLTAPHELVATGDFLEASLSDPDLRAELRAVTLERIDQFQQQLTTHGARLLLSYRAVQHYLTGRDRTTAPVGRPLAQRQAHIRHLLALMEEYPLRVGLMATIPVPELLLNLRALLLRQVRSWPTWSLAEALDPWGLPHPKRHSMRWDELFHSWGPRYFLFANSPIELRCYVEFERAWTTLPSAARERETIQCVLSDWLAGHTSSRRSLQLAEELGLRAAETEDR